MKYLFDTNILIDHLRRKKLFDKNLFDQNVGISIISYGELLYGSELSDNPSRELRKIEKLRNSLPFEIVYVSIDTLRIFASIKSRLHTKGKLLEDFDLLIAATAIENNVALVTRNTKHFKRIKGLKLLK